MPVVLVAALAVLLAVLIIGLLGTLLVLVRSQRGTTVRLPGALPASSPAAADTELEDARREAASVRSQAQDEVAELQRRARDEAADVRRQAETVAALARSAREDADSEVRELREDIREQRAALERREQRVSEREERVSAEAQHVEERGRELGAIEADLGRRRAELADVESERRQVLERIAGLTAEQAKGELLAVVETQAKREAAVLARDIERSARAAADREARSIITTAIQRVATEQTTESVVTPVQLPAEDMKGRIIGREGRNIRAFEQVTGVNVIIDDTPDAVLLSCFDPVRREVARVTLETLMLDGRIHPQRIEEQYDKSRADVERLCVKAGEDALVDIGLTDVHPELVVLLGRLRYRTSYGQNVLKHLVESGHIAGLMAAELGLDVALLKRCAFLHDIGKALTHEAEGSHAIVGAELARRYGECDDVVHAIEAHHNEVEPRTVEAVLTQAADAISGGRPGARRESLEAYVKRLQRLEEIAKAHDGVDKVFAMQAGREVRVMVLPEAVDDIQAQVLARDIAKQVEEELSYPGHIRITVVRESRASEVAR